jgi:serine/threonine protein kinase
VIGTPCWKDIESVPGEHWRAYLKKAGNIVKQLSGLVDDNALDLLQRMLAFAPQRRCSADEALFHTYFKGMNKSLDVLPYPLAGRGPSTLPDNPVWKTNEPAVALGLLERELEMSANHTDGGKVKLEQLLQREVEQQQRLTNLRRDTLRNLAIKAYSDRPVIVQQPPREFQLFPCATSRDNDYSAGPLMSTPENWDVERRGDQESQGDPSRASNGSEFSQPSGPVSMSYDSAPYLEDEPPFAKRSRNTRIRQGSFDMEMNRLDVQYKQAGETIGTSESISDSRVLKGRG